METFTVNNSSVKKLELFLSTSLYHESMKPRQTHEPNDNGVTVAILNKLLENQEFCEILYF
jgi:hypothetical protein